MEGAFLGCAFRYRLNTESSDVRGIVQVYFLLVKNGDVRKKFVSQPEGFIFVKLLLVAALAYGFRAKVTT